MQREYYKIFNRYASSFRAHLRKAEAQIAVTITSHNFSALAFSYRISSIPTLSVN